MENYTKVRIIGTGSFGTVWLARSKEKHRNYVLKQIPLSIVEERQRNFVLNEVKVLSQLRHMNIIRYKEAFLSSGFLCISMEYAYEGDLSDKIQKQHGQMFAKGQIIDWFVQLCLALKYIHGMNILHRDVKCQNIFLSKENVIKLGDFGIACVLQNTLDHAQTVIGTPYYLSPEICQRQPYNHKSDIWAVGCVLYEMITLHHPFESADFPQLVLKILHGDVTPIPEDHGTLMQDLVSVLLRVNPSERPSAKQILHIPAMQPYVSKVLARGRTQRSESVSCGEEQSVNNGGNVWRKPNVISSLEKESNNRSTSEGEVEPHNHEEDAFILNGDNLLEPFPVNAVGQEISKCRKRISSKVFPRQDGQLFDDCKKMRMEEEKFLVQAEDWLKENYRSTQHNPSKQRSYSTSIVRESVELNPKCSPRRPLAPLNRLRVRLRSTYDVIPETRPIFQGTYTKCLNSETYKDDEPPSHRRKRSERQSNLKNFSEDGFQKSATKQNQSGNSTFLEKDSSRITSGNSTNPKRQTEFLRVLLSGNHLILKSISPESSLKDYIQAMKSNLEEILGAEMFTVLYKYLRSDVHRDLDSGVDICQPLYEALGEGGIAFVPLMLQYIQCESRLSAEVVNLRIC